MGQEVLRRILPLLAERVVEEATLTQITLGVRIGAVEEVAVLVWIRQPLVFRVVHLCMAPAAVVGVQEVPVALLVAMVDPGDKVSLEVVVRGVLELEALEILEHTAWVMAVGAVEVPKLVDPVEPQAVGAVGEATILVLEVLPMVVLEGVAR